MHIMTTLALMVACLASPHCGPQDERAAGLASPLDERAAAPQSTGTGVFEVDVWPGEGRPRLVARTTTLSPRTEPRKDAPAGAVIRVENGRPLAFAGTVYRTSAPGRLKALKDTHVAGRRLGPVRRLSRDDYYSDRFATVSLPLRPGEVIDYLQDRAEGSCFVRVRGDVIDADPCPHLAMDRPDHFALESKPRTEWWVQVTVEGQPRGWLLVDGKKVREEGRTF